MFAVKVYLISYKTAVFSTLLRLLFRMSERVTMDWPGFNPNLLCERSATEPLYGSGFFNNESENNPAVILFEIANNIESEQNILHIKLIK
jgi:hypothetical protein